MDAEVESRGRSRCDTANSAAGRMLKTLSMTQKGVTYFNELYSTWFLPAPRRESVREDQNHILHVDLRPPPGFFSGRRRRLPTTTARPLQHRRTPFTTASASTPPAHRRRQLVVAASAPSPPGTRLVPGRSNVSKYVLVSVQDVCRTLTCIAHPI